VSARPIVAVLTLLVIMSAAVLTSSTVVAQANDEHVEMTPAEATLQTRLVFSGRGFTPGVTVSARFFPPDGAERRIRTPEGAEIVWPVQPDGTFSMEVVPAHRFPGAVAGRWRALFCASGSATCQQIEFDLAP
jgi:hypothetical protein